ncbi:MAG: hypothetical protein IKJ56_01235 [Bacteroidales bacterium]|nr:hypothetical protein [Bacteroidales bacterium]
MKKNILMAVFCLILSAMSFAQVPQMMSYQAVVRGSDNNLVANQQISMRVSILQGNTEGEAVYTETHLATTNANGLASIEIGNGTSNDDFTAISWANGPYFVKTETDINGGGNYEIVGVSQLLSVPYAMYAQSAGNMPDLSGFLSEENQNLADVVALGNSANAQIKDLVDPTENQDAATKKYIDELIAQLQTQNENLETAIEHLNEVVRLGGHDFVDLGLPSGTLWATCNVGANRPEEYGDYFAWGEITAKDTYDWSTYRYCNGSNTTLTKYCYDANYGYNGFTDNLTTLQPSDDAATANWGNGWRMPTSTEMQELIDNCTFEWITQNGVNGRKFTGTNGNSIFMPAAGYHNASGIMHAGSRGNYGSASLRLDHADWNVVLTFGSTSQAADISGERSRRYGQPVRPVYNPNDIGNGISEP